jgi:arylformamidase
VRSGRGEVDRSTGAAILGKVNRSVALLAVVLFVACCSTPDDDTSSAETPDCADPALPTTVAYRQIDGVDPDLTSVDVHTTPERCRAPVVVWVHGGGYQVGDKANQMAPKIALAEREGWVLVSANYRLTRPGEPGSARFPDHFDDVAAALAWVRDNIAAYGGDPDRLALLGHSAGGDIVANLMVNPAYLHPYDMTPDDVTCAGPLDTEGFDKPAVREGARVLELWEQALGNQPDYLSATSATRLVEPGTGIPTIGVVRGPPGRQAILTGFLDALDAAGVPTVLVDASSLTHDEVNRVIGVDGDEVMTPPLVAFLTDCFDRGAEPVS